MFVIAFRKTVAWQDSWAEAVMQKTLAIQECCGGINEPAKELLDVPTDRLSNR